VAPARRASSWPQLYSDVNYTGTLNVVRACKAAGCIKIVMSSSPSTRFDGKDVDGLTEAEMPKLPQKSYLQEYAKSKALGEMALRAEACDSFMTCAVAPHQVSVARRHAGYTRHAGYAHDASSACDARDARCALVRGFAGTPSRALGSRASAGCAVSELS
jgi:nucleoside-diphosphate-sugar epimerase